MKQSLMIFTAALMLAACGNESASTPAVTDSTESRLAIAIEYVHADGADVHAKPSDDSPIVTKFNGGESVSVLSQQGEWAEVRTATGSGWTRRRNLGDAVDAQKLEEDNLTPRFRVAPQPVAEPGAHGEIVLEASVSREGDVTYVRTVSNTTGNTGLAGRNTLALQSAKFHPIVQHGKRREFIYEYRVHY